MTTQDADTTTLVIDHARRFGGLSRLYGSQGAAQIFDAHVLVVGIGGVGSWAVEALARSGVGRITLIDMDHVSESNINRQIHALDATLGVSKIDAMRQRIWSYHPSCLVHGIDDFVSAANWQECLVQAQNQAPVSAVIDACDHLQAKTTMAAWALTQRNLSFIAVGAAGGKTIAQNVQVADMALTTHDPLLAKARYELRRKHGVPREGIMGIACVYSQEPVSKPQNVSPCDIDGTLNCHGYGSSVAVTATFGLVTASWVMQKLAKTPNKPK